MLLTHCSGTNDTGSPKVDISHQPYLKDMDDTANTSAHKTVPMLPSPQILDGGDNHEDGFAVSLTEAVKTQDQDYAKSDEIRSTWSNAHVEFQEDSAVQKEAVSTHEERTLSPQATFKTGQTRSLLNRLFEKRDELQQGHSSSNSPVRAPVRSSSCGKLDQQLTSTPTAQSGSYFGHRIAPYLCGMFDRCEHPTKLSGLRKDSLDVEVEAVRCGHQRTSTSVDGTIFRGFCASSIDSVQNENPNDTPRYQALPEPRSEALEAHQQRHFQNYVAGLEALGSPMQGEELLLAPFDALHPEEDDDSSSSDDEDDVARHRQWQDGNDAKEKRHGFLANSAGSAGKNFLLPYTSFPLHALCHKGAPDFEFQLDGVWEEYSACGGDKSSVPQRLPTASTLTSMEESCSFVLGGPDDVNTAGAIVVNGNQNESEKGTTVPDYPPLQVYPESDEILEACPRLLTPSMMMELWEELPPPQRLRTWVRAYSTVRDGDYFQTMLRLCAFYDQTIIVIRTSSGDILGGYADRPWGHIKDTAVLSPARSSSSLDLQNLPVSPSYPARLGACSPKSVFYGTGQSFLFASNPMEEEGSSPSPSPSFQLEEQLDDSNISSETKEKQLHIYHWTGENSFSQKFDLDGGGHLAMGGGSDFGFIIQDNFSTGRTGHSDTFGNPPLSRNTVDGRIDIVDCEVYGFRQGVL